MPTYDSMKSLELGFGTTTDFQVRILGKLSKHPERGGAGGRGGGAY